VFGIGVADVGFAMLLDLLQAEGKLRTLSRPSVSTLNNQKAIIKVATDDVFFETNTVLTAQGIAQTNVISRSVTIGVVLSVTPQIASDGYIIMDVHPTVTDSTSVRTFEAGGVSASRPVVDVRETNTVLRVKDGESIVIAGLVQRKSDRRVRKVPWLGSIPVLGVLFQQVKESSENTELVIKITPRIVESDIR
jgi:type II secretory pathway component GspD/PulD (secretin)